MHDLPPVECFVSSNGTRIYRIACEAFPGFIVYAYLLLDCGPVTLIDTGSGYGASDDHLREGIEAVRREFSEPVVLKDIKRIILTHGHIDHFGGAQYLLEEIDASIGIHQLDRRVLTAYEERVVVATKALLVYLQHAGVSPELQPKMLDMYGFSKQHVKSVPIDFDIADGQQLDGMEFIHTPGHCPGQVCIRLGDVLLSADHILETTTPHQAPESITAYMGLGHYLESLDKVGRMGGFDLALGGHEGVIRDVYKRIEAIRQSHLRKLDRVRDIIREYDGPATISDISKTMYPTVEGFHVLLALEEAGAHVEYLYQRGQLEVKNLDEVQEEGNPALRFEVI
jgi:glyoxylase-like metal-dependent hydrolase (beta-lactamase superfamily II)